MAASSAPTAPAPAGPDPAGVPRLSRRGRRLVGWDPEDRDQWEGGGAAIARRNLVWSVVAEHLGFSIWSVWSVLVLFLGPGSGFELTPAQKFLLVSVPTLTGALLRIPYTVAVTRFGGRRWTVFSALVLLVPAVAAMILVSTPGAPYWAFLLVAAVGGVGGGNFASSMTNINAFYPQRLKGRALGINAGGGNVGVATVQLVGLLVLATAGAAHPAYVLAGYLPLLALAGLAAALWMDDVEGANADTAAMREVMRDADAWVMSALYVGTFGSFIGFGFAFGLVLQTEFGLTPLQAASWTFLGPLLGSLSRPVGGWLADRYGGARTTLAVFGGLVVGTLLVLAAGLAQSFTLFVAAFVALFVLSGAGNGSTYKMIPAIFAAKTPDDPATVTRLSGALIGIAGAVGALGGVGINLAFRQSYGGATQSGTAAFAAFIACYLGGMALTYLRYLRRPSALPVEAAATPA